MRGCHVGWSTSSTLTVPGCCLAWCQHGGCCNAWAASEPRTAVGCKIAQLWCGAQHLCRTSLAPLVNSYYRWETNRRGQINATMDDTVTVTDDTVGSLPFSTSEAQRRDKDAACGRSVWRDEGSGTCHQDQHHSASWGILTLLNRFSACLSQTHEAIVTEVFKSKYMFKLWSADNHETAICC